MLCWLKPEWSLYNCECRHLQATLSQPFSTCAGQQCCCPCCRHMPPYTIEYHTAALASSITAAWTISTVLKSTAHLPFAQLLASQVGCREAGRDPGVPLRVPQPSIDPVQDPTELGPHSRPRQSGGQVPCRAPVHSFMCIRGGHRGHCVGVHDAALHASTALGLPQPPVLACMHAASVHGRMLGTPWSLPLSTRCCQAPRHSIEAAAAWLPVMLRNLC